MVVRRVGARAISRRLAGEQDQRDQGEGDAEGQHDLGEDQQPGGVEARRQQRQRGDGGDQPPPDQRDRAGAADPP